ncbi:MAG TPA: hypothetical protein VJT11_04735 [Nitrospiraceae bacterium]|nr:hypothetical protein [Nitrospiraceae bacterium]
MHALSRVLSAVRLHTGKTFGAGLIATGIALQAKAFKAATTAADRTATDQDTHRHR